MRRVSIAVLLFALAAAGCASVWPTSIFYLREDPAELPAGAAAPRFSLASASGGQVALGDLLGKGRPVIVFYRGAF